MQQVTWQSPLKKQQNPLDKYRNNIFLLKEKHGLIIKTYSIKEQFTWKNRVELDKSQQILL